MIFFRTRTALAALTLCLCPLLAAAQNAEPVKAPVARTMEKPQTIRDINGKTMFPFRADGARAKAFFFIVRDCPIANAYAPEINRIVADYAAKGVVFYLVYVDADAPGSELRQHYQEYGYRCPALRDDEGVLRRRWKAQKTPEAVVLRADGRVVYQGRIDDRFVDFGKSRHQSGRPDLRFAIDDVLAGKIVAQATTPVIGCPIPEIPSP